MNNIIKFCVINIFDSSDRTPLTIRMHSLAVDTLYNSATCMCVYERLMVHHSRSDQTPYTVLEIAYLVLAWLEKTN